MAEQSIDDINKAIEAAQEKNALYYEQAAAERELAQKEHNEKIKRLREDFAKVASTDEGKAVLNYIARFCNWDRSSIILTSEGSVSELATVANEHQRLVWLEIRNQFMPENIDLITKVENLQYYKSMKQQEK